MKIININGPINAGKSTISKLLAENLVNSKFIEVDDKLLEVENKLKADIVDIEASLANYVPRNSLKEINDEINNLQ